MVDFGCDDQRECFDQANVNEVDRFGGGNVRVWGEICHREKKDLVTIAGTLTSVRYCEEVVEPIIVVFLCQRHATLLQHDNAGPDTANHTKDGLRQTTSRCLIGHQDHQICPLKSTCRTNWA